MNALWILITALVLLILGYRFYGRFLSRQFAIDPHEKTPAHTRFDGVDFVPAKSWAILFGHHFSSIAGAGPIVGPILAVAFWGWMPAFLWIIAGSIFFGGVHDYGSLVISLKYRGNSIADISKDIMSKRARIIFVVFVWLALVLVIAVFAKLCAQTLSAQPSIVLPTVGLIPIACLIGFLMYSRGMDTVKITILGVGLLIGLIVLGKYIPIEINSTFIWLIILFVYSYIASITPVHVMLQPRDYLSSFLLVFGMIFGIIGIVITRPDMTSAAFISVRAENGGLLWPMLFVTVACGAISGFHCLVSSGTTVKQLPSQEYSCRIGYGSMLLEGALAVIAVICVAAGLSSKELQTHIFLNHNPIAAFIDGYGNLTRSFLGGFGSIFCATVLNAFILTTLDTATRIGRYLTEELFGIRNRYLATGIVVVFACFLTLSGSSSTIWPVFGASNQLVAALALLVISCWLLGLKKNHWFVSIPAGIMLITTVTALVLQGISFMREGKLILVAIIVILIFLAIFLVYETVLVFRKEFSKATP